MKKLAFMLFMALLGCGFAQDSRIDSQNQKSADSSANHNDSHQTSSEWEMIDFVKSDEVQKKKEALTSCYTTQNSAQNCAKILADWESLCTYNGSKYCLALYVIYSEIYESLRKDKKALDKIIATLRRQCDNNEANACLAISESYVKNKSGIKKSLPYFQKACDLGSYLGCAQLAELHYFGLGDELSKNRQKAQLYLDKALQIVTRDCQRKDGWVSPFNWQNEACKAIKVLDKIKSRIDSM